MTRTEEAEVVLFMQQLYGEIAADLPRYGHGHNDAAEDHAADRAHDAFHVRFPGVSFRKLARRALRSYLDSGERAATRRNERRWARAVAKVPRPVKTPPAPRPRKLSWAERGRIRLP